MRHGVSTSIYCIYVPHISTGFNKSFDLLWEQRVGSSNPSSRPRKLILRSILGNLTTHLFSAATKGTSILLLLMRLRASSMVFFEKTRLTSYLLPRHRGTGIR